eukprot:5394965-Karenia_brevis.AAC.1
MPHDKDMQFAGVLVNHGICVPREVNCMDYKEKESHWKRRVHYKFCDELFVRRRHCSHSGHSME